MRIEDEECCKDERNEEEQDFNGMFILIAEGFFGKEGKTIEFEESNGTSKESDRANNAREDNGQRDLQVRFWGVLDDSGCSDKEGSESSESIK